MWNKMKKSQLSKLVALLVVTTVIAGCSASAPDTTTEKTTAAITEKETNIAFMAYNSEPVLDWDPSSSTSNEIIVFHNVYETLTRYNVETGNVDPLIAESYSVSDDGLTWEFVIRQGMKFHDGTDVNAEAVKFSIDRTMEKNLGAAYIWSAVEDIEVIDDYTVRFNLTYASPIQYIASSGYGAFIMSPKTLSENDEEWLNQGNDAGSGPYVVKRSKMGEEVLLEAFEDYWGGWNDNQYTTIVIQKISESSSRRQLIESGDATVTLELPPEDVDALKESSAVTIHESETFTNMMFHLNTQVAPLDNVQVRQALSYAFPYEDVINYAAGGYGSQPYGVIPDGILGHDETVSQYHLDLDKAKALLAEAGYPDGGFSLELSYLSGDEFQKKTAELYKSELKKIGVELEIRSMPWDSYYELAQAPNPEDRQDIFAVYWWPDNALPSSWFQQLYYSEEDIYWNMSYYSNPEYDALIDEADATLYSDEAAAEKLYIEANQFIVDQALSIFVMDSNRVFVSNASMKGLVANPAYDTVVFFYDCYKE